MGNRFSDNLSRRSFIKGMAVTGALSASFGLTSCSQPDSKDGQSPESNDASQHITPIETLETDILIVGSGLSGLASGVEAALGGYKVIMIEGAGTVGGNGTGVEGTFAIDSSMQKELGIAIKPREVIAAELEYAQLRNNGLLWMDLVKQSGSTLDWMLEQGVEFDGAVDGYLPDGDVHTFHWFKGKHAGEGYIPQMQARFEELGGTIMMGTSGHELITDEDKVVGIYAETGDGYIQINAKAVILATGSFGSNPELVEQRGYDIERTSLIGKPGHDGGGILMAEKVGAKNLIQDSCSLCGYIVDGVNDLGYVSSNPLFGAEYSDINQIIRFGGAVLWVNENGERFVTEHAAKHTIMGVVAPSLNQKRHYVIFDQAYLDSIASARPQAADQLKKLVELNPSNNVFQANTLEELSRKSTIPIMEAANRYNTLCELGDDEDFGKDSSMMIELTHAPFYILRLDYWFRVAIGGLHTSRNFEVLTEDDNTIPGLYAVGVDGVELFRNVYTINIPGSCSMNCINSGRVAVKAAGKYIG